MSAEFHVSIALEPLPTLLFRPPDRQRPSSRILLLSSQKRSFLPFWLAFLPEILKITFRPLRRRGTLPLRRDFLPIPRSPMAIKRSTKKTLITKHRKHTKDTGSPQVQIAILTKEIKLLTDHLKEHKKDHSARRGLLGKVAQRRKLLLYLRMNKPEEYQEVLETHGLKK